MKARVVVGGLSEFNSWEHRRHCPWDVLANHDRRQVDLLQRYETHVYKPATCSIHVEKDWSTTDDGLTFVWASNPESNERKDGGILPEKYQCYFKTDAFEGRYGH